MLALAAYGYTGVNSGEISSYSYWCIEKGYPARIGRYDGSEAWYRRARGWLKVLRTDVWITLVLLTCASNSLGARATLIASRSPAALALSRPRPGLA